MIDLKNKIFLDTDGEMTFENKERLNFIMHYMKIGAHHSTLETKDSKFVHQDTETAFLEIWLPCAESKQAEIDSLKAQLGKYENKRFFSHDFNGDGFQYHDTLEEAKKEAEASLDWYRDRVAGGHHVEDDGEFKELCFGVVLASADYNVDEVVTKEHHMNDEWTQYEVGTEILSLDFYEEPVKPSQENSHE